MVRDGRLVEGHPIGLDKIILGDLREKTWTSEEQVYTNKNSEGTILYDRTEKPNRPWFLLAYESGKRIENN